MTVGDPLDSEFCAVANATGMRRRSGWFARFPVTSLFLLQYGVLAILPGWRHGNPHEGFIVWIVAVAAVSAFVGELAATRRHSSRYAVRRSGLIDARSSAVVTAIGFAALYASALLGARTYSTQIGATASSPIARVATPFIAWVLIGSALSLHCYAAGHLSRRAVLVRLGLTLAGYVGYVLLIGRTAPLAAFALSIAVGALLVGLVQPRWLLIGLIVGFLIWPPLYSVRNGARSQIVAVGTYGQNVSASQRLREDLLLGPAANYSVPLHIPAPSAAEILRYGLVPSAIDPLPRPPLSTAAQLSLATGSSATNSVTFTLLGNVRLFIGTPGLILLCLLLGFCVSVLGRVISPIRLVMLMSSIQSVIWIESTFPDGFVGMLQMFSSTVIAMAGVWLVKQLRSPKKGKTVFPGSHPHMNGKMSDRKEMLLKPTAPPFGRQRGRPQVWRSGPVSDGAHP